MPALSRANFALQVPVISVPVLAVSAFAFAKEYKSLWVLSLAVSFLTQS